MSYNVEIYQDRTNKRSALLCDAIKEGVQRLGYKTKVKYADMYAPDNRATDIAIFYGLKGTLKQIQKDYSENGTAIFVDLGYWGRHDGGRMAGFHRVVVNDIHIPTRWFDLRLTPRTYIPQIPFTKYKKDGHLLLLGMSDKSAWVHDLDREQFEKEVLTRLNPGYNIVYRPKPSWEQYTNLPGTRLSVGRDIQVDLLNCRGVITHHSQAVIESLCHGIPVYSERGIGACELVGNSTIEQLLHNPHMPDTAAVTNWLSVLSHFQWRVQEFRDGLPFKFLKELGEL